MAKVGKKIKEGAEWVGDKVTDAAVWVVEHTMPDTAKKLKKVAADKAKEKIDQNPDMTEEEKQARKDAIDEFAEDPNSLSKVTKANEGGVKGITEDPMSALEKAGYGPEGGYEKAFSEAAKSGENRIATEQEELEDDTARQARLAAANEENVARKSAYQAARNTGANRAASSAISGSNTPMSAQSGMQSALRNAATSTQADYLSKMGYANALDLQSKNLEKGAFLNNISAILGGAGQGAATGASLGGI